MQRYRGNMGKFKRQWNKVVAKTPFDSISWNYLLLFNNFSKFLDLHPDMENNGLPVI